MMPGLPISKAVVLPLGLMGVVAIILVPMPSFVMDFLIGVSFASSLLLLALSLHVESTLHLSTFPSLLLITTLLRLALSIASTKLILLHAHAGQLIDVFGKMVVGGNVIVGLVIFVIITLVQFVVIAKGSERVAEVGARFTLDSMPGKQMSIEADLRAGLMTLEEARAKRQHLDQESQFHGSMDGAMKFVKGDAIATLLIALVNAVAGLAIGIGVNGMRFTDALARYTILTVGDGMVAQLPSLLTSVSAGILITRVSGAVGVRLSEDIQRQIAAQPLVLLLIGGVLVAVAMLPGLPHLQLGALGLLLLFGGRIAMKRLRAKNAQDDAALSTDDARLAEVHIEQHLPQFSPGLWVSVSPSMASWFDAPWAAHELQRSRVRLTKRFGLPLPRLQFFVDDDLEGDRYVVNVFDLVVGNVSVPGASYARRGMQATETGSQSVEIPFLGPIVWVPAAAVGNASEPQWWSVYALLANHVEAVALAHAETLLGLEETHQLLSKLEREMPELAKEALKASPLPRTSEVLRRLASERISMRSLRTILESLVNWAGRERDNAVLTEQVRLDIGLSMMQRFVDSDSVLHAIMFDAPFEQALIQAVEPSPRGGVLAMPVELRTHVQAALQSVLAQRAPEGQELPVLVDPDLRRFLAKFLAPRFPQLCVFSYPEVARSITVKPLTVISQPLTTLTTPA
jgi:type III secretion protein V